MLWNKGIYLGERKQEEYTIALYQIDGFYVEVFYRGENNQIERLRSFHSVDQFKPYLERMDIANLL